MYNIYLLNSYLWSNKRIKKERPTLKYIPLNSPKLMNRAFLKKPLYCFVNGSYLKYRIFEALLKMKINKRNINDPINIFLYSSIMRKILFDNRNINNIVYRYIHYSNGYSLYKSYIPETKLYIFGLCMLENRFNTNAFLRMMQQWLNASSLVKSKSILLRFYLTYENDRLELFQSESVWSEFMFKFNSYNHREYFRYFYSSLMDLYRIYRTEYESLLNETYTYKSFAEDNYIVNKYFKDFLLGIIKSMKTSNKYNKKNIGVLNTIPFIVNLAEMDLLVNYVNMDFDIYFELINNMRKINPKAIMKLVEFGFCPTLKLINSESMRNIETNRIMSNKYNLYYYWEFILTHVNTCRNRNKPRSCNICKYYHINFIPNKYEYIRDLYRNKYNDIIKMFILHKIIQ